MFGKRRPNREASGRPEQKELVVQPKDYPVREGSPFTYTSEVKVHYGDYIDSPGGGPYVDTRFQVGGIELDYVAEDAMGRVASAEDIYMCSLTTPRENLERVRAAAEGMKVARLARNRVRQVQIGLSDEQELRVSQFEAEFWAAIKEIVQPLIDEKRYKDELARVAQLALEQKVRGEVDELLDGVVPCNPNGEI